jgi:hypothetical protein
MARSGKAQKQLTSKIKGERLIKDVIQEPIEITQIGDERPVFITPTEHNKKTKKLKSES